ncbi:MAG: ABC transporter substrate-binding protein [Candidatus Saccharibacteria bacterium]|nr:ABC transporter substrate-binding protein [Candidatus Saccharibacteria bacterium]
MAEGLKKRGQKFVRKFSRASIKASEEGKEHIKENFLKRLSHIKNIRLLVLEWVLLVIALILLAVSQAFWFGESYATDAYIDGGTYIEATVGRVNSMNPLFATTTSEKILSKLMFATLTYNDFSGQPGPGLASSVTYSDDGKVWRIKLRDGLVWSDGEPITNEDVLFTMGLIQNPLVSTIFTANLENVKVAEDENGYIVFVLPSAYADFVSALNIPIVPKHILENVPIKTLVEADFSKSPVTSGPFNFNAAQDTNSSDDEKTIYLNANPNYYLGKPMVSSFAIHVYNDKDAIIDALNAGSATATAELAGEDVEKISGTYYKRLSGVDAGAFAFLNNSRGLLASADFRRAIRQGLKMSEIRSAAPGTTALNFPILKSQIELEYYPNIPTDNPEEAKAKIAELSGGEQAKLEIATVDSGYLPAVAEKLAENLRELGIECTVIPYAESQEFVANVISKRNYDILVYEIELGSDPDPLPYYHSSQAKSSGLNLSNYRNTLVDDLLVGARGTMDETLRMRKYEKFLEYWATDVPAIGLYQANMTYIYNKNVQTYNENNVLVTALDRLLDVQNWAVNKGTKNQTP